MKKIIGVYKISNNLCPEWKYYIGYSCDIHKRWGTHRSTLKTNKHCNILLQRAYDKYGADCFTYEILHVCETEEEAQKYELSYLEDENIRDKLYNLHYNSSGGDMLTYHPNREEIIEKINKTQKEQISKMTKEERQAKWGQNGEKNGMYGRTHTDEVKQLFSNLHKGNTYNLGRKVSQETKDKLSTIASQRLGEKNHFFGKQHSKETKTNIGLANCNRIPANRREVQINGKIYTSVTAAGNQLLVCTATILYRIKSPNPKFANYFYVDTIQYEFMPPSVV